MESTIRRGTGPVVADSPGAVPDQGQPLRPPEPLTVPGAALVPGRSRGTSWHPVRAPRRHADRGRQWAPTRCPEGAAAARASVWASIRCAERMAAVVSARDAATTSARPARAWARRCRDAGAASVRAACRAGGAPRSRATCSAMRSPAGPRPSSSVTARRAARCPASWMSSSSSRLRCGKSASSAGLWTDGVRIGSYMDGLPVMLGIHPTLDRV
ncbi:protein of unknown function [Streptomyces sp. KY70]|nr:protein of unknown function [Streptomyces sp. KY70]